MKSQSEFKALVQQKMKQQARAAHIRNQRLSALGASALVLTLAVGLSWYFLKNPIVLPLKPEDNIPETQSQIVTNDGSAAGNMGENDHSTSLPDTSGGTTGSTAAGNGGSASTGSSAGGAITPGTHEPSMGSERTISAAEVTAVEYRLGKQTAQRSTDKASIQTFLTAMVQRKQQSFQCSVPETYNAELTLTFYDGEEILLTLILTEQQEMLCQFSRYVTECVELSESDYEDLYDLAPTPYSTPVKGEKIPVVGTVFDTATLTVDSQTTAIVGAEMYPLFDTINRYFPESRQRKVTLRNVTHQIQYTNSADPEKSVTISLDKSTGALRWQYGEQEMTVALNADQRKQLTTTLGSYFK